jgi:hypothetical protein
MKFNKLSWLLTFIVSLNLYGCINFTIIQTSTPLPILPTKTAVPTSTETLEPTATEVFRQNISATATDIQLPYNLVTESSEYCQVPPPILQLNETENLSEDQIVYKLVELWLNRYKKPGAHPYCRIDDYTVDRVYYDKRITSPPIEPQGDIMRVVVFSMKLIQIPNDWMTLAGEIDQNNWLHTAQTVAIFKTDKGYIMKFANP